MTRSAAAFGTRGLYLCCLAQTLSQLGEEGDPERIPRHFADEAAKASERLFEAIRRGEDDRAGYDAVRHAETLYARYLNPPKPEPAVKPRDTTLVGEYDERPGNYYVVSHRQGQRPENGFHRLAGPFPTHREADIQVRAVQAYAERVGGGEAFYQHYITARCEPGYAPKSVLGNDPRKWVHL